MAAFNVPFVNVTVHQPGQQAQPPVPVVLVNKKLRLKGLEEALGLQHIRIMVADQLQGIVLTMDNDGFADIPPLKPGSTIEVCGVPAPANNAAGMDKPWWFSEALARTGIATTPSEQFTTGLTAGGAAWGFVHYWRKAQAVMAAHELRPHNPDKAWEYEARYSLTEYQIKKAAYWSRRFKSSAIAALGAPLLYVSWLRAGRLGKQSV